VLFDQIKDAVSMIVFPFGIAVVDAVISGFD
jgi:hypothetical protein